MENAFLVRLTLRENEKGELLRNPQVDFTHEALAAAKKYSEGFLVEFFVTDSKSFNELKLFITGVINLR